MNFDFPGPGIENPVFRDGGLGVEAGLFAAIIGQGAVADLDDQVGFLKGRLRGEMAFDDGEIDG